MGVSRRPSPPGAAYIFAEMTLIGIRVGIVIGPIEGPSRALVGQVRRGRDVSDIYLRSIDDQPAYDGYHSGLV